jgi:hypothetical protein
VAIRAEQKKRNCLEVFHNEESRIKFDAIPTLLERNVGCDAYQSEGLLISLLYAVFSQRETNLPLMFINTLACASQPTWSSSIMQRPFLLSFPHLLSSSSPFKYTLRFCNLHSQPYHNRLGNAQQKSAIICLLLPLNRLIPANKRVTLVASAKKDSFHQCNKRR